MSTSGFVSRIKAQVERGSFNTSDFNVLVLAMCSVILIMLARLASQLSTWSTHKGLLSYFFEDNSEFILAVTVYLPILLLLATLTTSSKQGHLTIGALGFLFGVASWFISYNFTSSARTIFSQLNGFYPMSTGLGDWWSIPDIVGCRDNTGCARSGGTNGYGIGWRILSPLANDKIALILGGVMAGYVCYGIAKYAYQMNIQSASLMVFLSPSMIFSLERGQSDIFLVGLIFIFLSFKKVNAVTSALVTMALLAMKPFFVVAFLRDKPKALRILLLAPIFLLTYLFSMNFSFVDIQNARNSTLYWPKSQFGVDQLPSLFIQFFDKKYHVNEIYWQGATSFRLSLVVGLIVFALVYAASLKRSLRHLNVLNLDSLELPERNLILIFSSLYLLMYLSGSEVAYKTWVAFPILILSLRRFLELKKRAKPSVIVFMSLILFGGFAIHIWTLRSIGTFMLAIYCAHVVTYFYKDSFFVSKLTKKSTT